MKVFRDIFAAVLIGIMGGMLVSTISYYNQHKEGGVLQTAMAVVNSFHEVASAYSDLDEENLYDGKSSTLSDQVIEAFERVEGGEVDALTESVFQSLLEKDAILNTGGDVIAMEGDGHVDEGEPYSEILRFHVRANSDTEEDQMLKMAVKEDVIRYLKPLMMECKNVSESKDVIVSNLQNIYTVAVDTIVEQGYDYDVKVYLTEETFPAKSYGDMTFPEGDYQALRIDIGEANGKNWWCVMYPPLCFVDESTAVISEDGKHKLSEVLTKEEYEDLFAYINGHGEDVNTSFEITGESWLWNHFFGEKSQK